ncbi:phosphotransferase, partial [Bdellovibrionota bacterium FG-2]
MKTFKIEVRLMMDQMALGDKELSEWVSRSQTINSVDRLPGDASTRRYYRVQSDSQSTILMRMESFAEKGADLPFLEVQRHLKSSGVDVPNVLDFDAERGFILLEDLGDVTMLRCLQDVASPEVERHLYQRVIDSLIHLQVYASPPLKTSNIEGYNLRFNEEKLLWEVHHTIEHFYESYLKRTISPADQKVMEEGFGEICKILAAEPVVLAHRDFHSRNVMVMPQKPMDRLVMIDFQDARLGPVQYDLASLLKDSYYQLEESEISFLLDYYVARFEAFSGTQIDRIRFRRIFDLMAV